MGRARELGLPATGPIGIGIYRDVFVLDFKNRRELFDHLNKVGFEDLLEDFLKNSRRMTAACTFCKGPTDIRADEILYPFMLPSIERILDIDDCRDYLKWLGSSCAYNLRLHHDNDIMHGTIPKGAYVMTNSHVANHLVGEEKTWMTDYHMAGKAEVRGIQKVEVYCLSYVMNPLPWAEAIGRAKFMPETFPHGLYDRQMPDRSPSVMLTTAFMDGIELGYYRRRIFDVEPGLKRDMLRKLVKIKEKMWQIYGIPEGMQRGLEYIPYYITSRKTTERDLNEVMKALQG